MVPLADAASLLLFVPADRPERYEKAFGAGADAVIIDLEDAVSPERKTFARSALRDNRDVIATATCPVIARLNPHGSPFFDADFEAVADLPVSALMLTKVESADHVRTVVAGHGKPVLALIESARGLAAARAVAEAGARLVFGSYDYAADLGCTHARDPLLAARSELVLASRLAGRAPPIDGVTTDIRDPDRVRDDAAYAAGLGFGGKMLIHPAQVEPARAGFRPSEAEIAWAVRVLAAGRSGGAVALDGMMVDAPLRLRAEQIELRAGVGRTDHA